MRKALVNRCLQALVSYMPDPSRPIERQSYRNSCKPLFLPLAVAWVPSLCGRPCKQVFPRGSSPAQFVLALRRTRLSEPGKVASCTCKAVVRSFECERVGFGWEFGRPASCKQVLTY